jgi:hypothetical protein
LTLAAADRETSPKSFYFEDAHSGSPRSVACLNDARLERSLDCSKRDGPIPATRSRHTRRGPNTAPAVVGELSRRQSYMAPVACEPWSAFRSRLTEPITETTHMKQPPPFQRV